MSSTERATDGAVRGRTVLVTGASGFIGGHLVRRLADAGAYVHAFARHAPTGAPARPWLGDVTDYAAVQACYRAVRPEIVIHLAADTSTRRCDATWDAIDRSVAVNLVGTLNVVRGAMEPGGRVERVVRLGGLEEYGTAATPYDEDARERPVSPYSASQVAATHFCQVLQARVSAALVTLRPALVYGPGQSTDFLVPSLIESCLRDEDFAMTDGTQRRDLLYIDDLVDALIAAVTRVGLHGAIINVGSGAEHAIRDVADAIVRLTGTAGRLRLGARPERPGDLPHLLASTARAERLLGWRARVALHDGLARTVAWHRRGGRTTAARPDALVR